MQTIWLATDSVFRTTKAAGSMNSL